MTDAQIAAQANVLPVVEMAKKLNIDPDDLHLFGKYKAKIPLSYIDEEKAKNARLILVSAISPTPAGEGKTTCSIGVTQALNRLGKKATVVLREPSLGPVFGIKGGATGGGYSQVLPMEDINLHFTGDFSAIEKANNLLAAIIDNNIQNRNNNIGIDPRTVAWKRVMDMNDRSIRQIVTGLGGKGNGVPREAGFNITAASEIMAILCLAKNITDLKTKIGNIYIGMKYDGTPVFARDLKAEGAMAALLKDAILPNLVQTIENTPAIIHGGPFANIAQGTNSVIATKMGLSLSDYVVTEAGFGFDLGGEKFLDIKCRLNELNPDAVVIVATVRALKYHGGTELKDIQIADPEAVGRGFVNLEKHIENAGRFGYEPIIVINKFPADTEDEIQTVVHLCEKIGVKAFPIDIWSKGGAGALDMAEYLIEKTTYKARPFKPTYSLDQSMQQKIKAIATKIYGASGVEYQQKAKADLKLIKKLGLEHLPVCIAKTQKSLSDDADLRGRPTDFVLTVREIEIAAGAGFVVPITGEIMRMPGLPEHPASENIDIDDNGVISGLF